MRLCACLVLFACGDKTPPPDPVPVPLPTPVKPAEDAGRVLLVRGDQRPEQYLAITLPDDPKATPAFDDLGTRDTAIASFHKGRWVYAGPQPAADHRVVVAVPSSVAGGKPSYQVVVPGPPTALHVVNDALYIGMAGSVGWIDLAAPKPAYVELVKRDNPNKPYDRFAREGHRLLAIDDEVMPMYADWFSLDPAGRPIKRLGDWTLPNVINGHYMEAALLPIGEHDFTLFLVAWYTGMTATGHVVMAVPVHNDRLTYDRNIALPNRDGRLPALIEHKAHGGKRKDELLAGDHPTLIADLAIARRANKLLLAAQERGLMIVPADFNPRTRTAELVDLGGSVTAVHAHGERLFAIVVEENQASSLVEIDPISLKSIARHALPATYHQFVD